MQVLKNSKMKYVSAVGVHLLISFWIDLQFSHSSRSYWLTIGKKKKKPLADFTCETGFVGLPGSCRKKGAGLIFFFFCFPVVPQGWGLSLDYNNHRCPVSSPHPQRAVRPTLSTLHFCQASTNNPSHFATL